MWIKTMNGESWRYLSAKELTRDLTEFLEFYDKECYIDEIISMFKRCGFKPEKYHD